MIVVLVLLALPLRLDGWEGGAAITPGVTIRLRLWRPVTMSVEDPSVGAIEVTVCKVGSGGPFADRIAGILANVCKNVGADIPAT